MLDSGPQESSHSFVDIHFGITSIFKMMLLAKVTKEWVKEEGPRLSSGFLQIYGSGKVYSLLSKESQGALASALWGTPRRCGDPGAAEPLGGGLWSAGSDAPWSSVRWILRSGHWIWRHGGYVPAWSVRFQGEVGTTAWWEWMKVKVGGNEVGTDNRFWGVFP